MGYFMGFLIYHVGDYIWMHQKKKKEWEFFSPLDLKYYPCILHELEIFSYFHQSNILSLILKYK